MEEYTKNITMISGEMWKAFKPMITEDMTTDEFWTKAIKTFTELAEKYKDTDYYGYAGDMAVFYLKQLQRICRKEFQMATVADYTQIIKELAKKEE